MAYLDYLNSNHWKQERESILIREKNCFICDNDDELIVHHKTYENIGNEQYEDLVVLCNRCHGIVHKNNKNINTDNMIILYNDFADKLNFNLKSEYDIFFNIFNGIEKERELYFCNILKKYRMNIKKKVDIITKLNKKLNFIESIKMHNEKINIVFKDEFIFSHGNKNNFTIYFLDEISKLSTRFTIKFYMMYCKYKNQKFYKMKLDDFKIYFGITNYKNICDIDKRILKTSEKEMNFILNKNIKYSKIKYGRNITHIMFNFNEEE